MRRTGNLFEKIVERDNLRLAFHAAAKGKRSRVAVRAFAENLEERLSKMSRQLRAGDFPIGKYEQFLICDPKQRIITAPDFPERVMHHAIVGVCEPLFDQWLIGDCYACRKDKGREAAVIRAAAFSRRFRWLLKFDVCKYFDSIDHERLLALLRRRFKDERLLGLFERIATSFRGGLGRGLPIGSLTSQHFANFYLGWFDRFAKETLRVKGYVRYMDDCLLWHDDRETLSAIGDRCREWLGEELKLEVRCGWPKATSQGIDFLGARIFDTHTILSRRSRRRWRRRMRLLDRALRLGLIDEDENQRRATAATAYVQAAGVRSWRFRAAVLDEIAVGGR